MREHSLQGEEWKIRYGAALSLCRHTQWFGGTVTLTHIS